ncbi:MAG TPA: stage II sporulation protein D [Firmicutes bacterium]|nr:stage II sporulation protein D [Bacillota bacterium]
MRWIISGIVLLGLLLIVIPALMVRGWDFRSSPSRPAKTGDGVMITVYLHDQGKSMDMNLEEYVKGVVAAEMPAEFDLEALKAQAVAGRTYAARHMRMYGGAGSPQHPEADISTDPREGQAWLGEQALKKKWGTLNYHRYWSKISRAVEETGGMVLTYKGEMINALFHSTSGGQTEDPGEIWGQQIPYLKSIPCPWDQKSPRYKGEREFSIGELADLVGPEAGVVTAAQNGSNELVNVVEKTASGRVKKVRIGSKIFEGTAVREKLGLYSTNFTWRLDGDKIIFATTGYGHGVGMSQYGANGMAKEGKGYKEILLYFYQGTELANVYGS